MNAILSLLPDCADASRKLLQVALPVLAQSTILLLFGLIAGRAARRYGPGLQAFLYRATLCSLLLAAPLTFVIHPGTGGFWRFSLPTATAPTAIPTAPAKAEIVVPFQPFDPAIPDLVQPIPIPLTDPSPAFQPWESERFHVSPVLPSPVLEREKPQAISTPILPPSRPATIGWIYLGVVGIWTGIAALLVGWLALCYAGIGRLVKRSSELTGSEAAELQRLCLTLGVPAPRLLVCPSVRSVFLAGLRRPAILLPVNYQEALDPGALRGVLAHELAHLKRRDCAWTLLARLLCAVLWLQPLLWLLCYCMEEAIEQVCDQVALEEGCPRKEYARSLVRLAEALTPSRSELVYGSGILGVRSSLGRRLQAILAGANRGGTLLSTQTRALVAAGVLGAVGVALALMPAQAALPQGSPTRREEVPTPSGLQQDTRLNIPVSLEYQRQPLGSILAALQKQTQVKLTASREVSDEKATLYLRQRPAREVLALVARHFDFRWYRKGDGYELVQDLAAKRREASLRAALRAEQMAAIVERMDLVAARASQPYPRLQARRQEIARQLRSANLEPEEQERLRNEQSAIADVLRNCGRICGTAWGSLTPAQRQRLGTQGELRLSTTDKTLSPALMRQLARESAEGFNRSVTPLNGETRDPTEIPDSAHLRMRILDEWPYGSTNPRRGDRTLRMVIDVVTVRGNASNMMPWSLQVENHGAQATPNATQTTDPDLLRLIDLPLTRLKESGETRQLTFGPGRFARTLTLVPLDGLLRVLNRITGLEFAADSFIRSRVDVTQICSQPGRPVPVVRILDNLADALDYRWSKEGNLIRLRSRYYPFDRPEEVPERTIQLLSRAAARPSRAPADSVATLSGLSSLALALTDDQCRSLKEFRDWYFEDRAGLNEMMVDFLYQNRYPLRFWASLSPVQLRQALSGAELPERSLNAGQRQAYQRAAATLHSSPASFGYDPWWESGHQPNLSPAGLIRALVDTERAFGSMRLYGPGGKMR